MKLGDFLLSPSEENVELRAKIVQTFLGLIKIEENQKEALRKTAIFCHCEQDFVRNVIRNYGLLETK